MPAQGSAVTHTPMVFDLIDLSEDLPMSNSTNFGSNIGRTIEDVKHKRNNSKHESFVIHF